eukprot:GEMP01014189.1.p1 GENE.GEMP01014189.1~~GEMP01014189.1.p1  ORF type:complete len:341 (+),score=52.34 GEMP01014189.1:1301-2323(+)
MGASHVCGYPMDRATLGCNAYEFTCMRRWREIQDEIRRMELEKNQYGPFFVEIDERIPAMRISVSHPQNDVHLQSDNHEFLTESGPLVEACGLVGASSLARRLDTDTLEVILSIPPWALGINAYELTAIQPIPGLVPCKIATIPRTREASHFAFVPPDEKEMPFKRPEVITDSVIRRCARVLLSAVAKLHSNGLTLFGLVCPKVILQSKGQIRIIPIGALVTFRVIQTMVALDPTLLQFLAPEMRRWLSRGQSNSWTIEQCQKCDVFAIGNFVCLVAFGLTTGAVGEVPDGSLRNFLVALCAVDVRARWTSAQGLEHPWLKNGEADPPLAEESDLHHVQL